MSNKTETTAPPEASHNAFTSIATGALSLAVQARLLGLLVAREERAADWRDSKEIIGWDSPMDCRQRMARLHLLVTLMAIYHRRPSLKDEAFDEFLRILTGEREPQADTRGARAFERASQWLTHLTREGIIAAARGTQNAAQPANA